MNKKFSNENINILEVIDIAKNWNNSAQNHFSLPDDIECFFEIINFFASNKIIFQVIYVNKDFSNVLTTSSNFVWQYPTVFIPTIVSLTLPINVIKSC